MAKSSYISILVFSFITIIIIPLDMFCQSKHETSTELSDSIMNITELLEIEITADNVLKKGNQDIVTITAKMREGKNYAIELLQDVNSLHYNPITKKVSFLGSENIKILVDSVEYDENHILNLPHNKFEKIDIIKKPTGKYSNYELLINLRTKKNYTGYDGYLTANAAMRTGDRNGVGRPFKDGYIFGSFNSTWEKFSISSILQFISNHAASSLSESEKYPLNNLIYIGLPDTKKEPAARFSTSSYYGHIGAEYRFNLAHRISMAYSLAYSPFNLWIDYKYDVANYTDLNYSFLEDKYKRHYDKNLIMQTDLVYNGKINCWDLTSYITFQRITNNLQMSHSYTDGAHMESKIANRQNNFYFFTEAKYTFPNNVWSVGISDYIAYSHNSEYDLLADSEHSINNIIKNTTELVGSFRPDSYFSIQAKVATFLMTNKFNNLSATHLAPRLGMSATWNPASVFNLWFNYQTIPTLNYASDLSEYGYFYQPLQYSKGNPFLKPGFNHEFTINLSLLRCITFQGIYTRISNYPYKIMSSTSGARPDGLIGPYIQTEPQNGQGNTMQLSVMYQKSWKHWDINGYVGWKYEDCSYLEWNNHRSRPFGNFMMQYRTLNNTLRFLLHYQLTQSFGLTPQATDLRNTDSFGIMIGKSFNQEALNIEFRYILPLHFTTGKCIYLVSIPEYYKCTDTSNQFRDNNLISISAVWRFQKGKKSQTINPEIKDLFKSSY